MKVQYSQRVIAYLIDVTVGLVISLILFFAFDIQFIFPHVDYLSLLILVLSIVLFLYFSLTYIIFDGISLGRICTLTKLTKTDGRRVDIPSILIRSLMQAIIIIAPINIIYQMFYKTPVSLYDYVTDTVIVYIGNK